MRTYILAALACAAAAAIVPLRADGAVFGGTLDPDDGTKAFTFTGSSQGGIGSAKMKIAVSQSGGTTTVVADIWNTSPTTYGSGQTNLATITGFGFNIAPNTPYSSYSIYAERWDGSSFVNVLLGDTNPAGNLWDLVPNSGSGQFQVDLFADNGPGIDGALYNPALAGNPAIGNTNPYFTAAHLTITFPVPLVVAWGYYDEPSCEDNGIFATPIVRLQRVGNGGSLKLAPDGPPFSNPEPQSLIIWGLAGGAALLFAIRRRKAAAIA